MAYLIIITVEEATNKRRIFTSPDTDECLVIKHLMENELDLDESALTTDEDGMPQVEGYDVEVIYCDEFIEEIYIE